MKNQNTPFVEVKQVIWSKDSHGLFDYESKNISFTKNKVDSSSHIYKEGTEMSIRGAKGPQSLNEFADHDSNYLFSITTEGDKKDAFYLHSEKDLSAEDNDKPFVVIRSLKDEDGNQKGHDLELGDIIRMGRIEYRVIEFQNHFGEMLSLLSGSSTTGVCPFSISVKDCNSSQDTKKQCRICLLDEQDTEEVLVNPCNCKGTSEYVHVQCLQDWINSKLKKKVNTDATCFYWKKLICEVCKISLPDLVDVEGSKKELIPIYRPEGAYILLERVFYDKTKENADNAKMMVLLNVSNETQQIKFGRGHDCDLRENDISVSRLHAFIKYQDGHFTIFDNNSKFGTLVLLRKPVLIHKKKKVALQFGRTVVTFSLKYPVSKEISTFKKQLFLEQLSKWQTPKGNLNIQINPANYIKTRSILSPNNTNEAQKTNLTINKSFLD